MQMKIWLLAYSLPNLMLLCQPDHVAFKVVVKIHRDFKVEAKEISYCITYKCVEKKTLWMNLL